MKKRNFIFAITAMVLMAILISGCSTGERKYGLEPEAVVKTAFQEAKSGRLQNAAAYVAPSALKDGNVSGVSKMLTGYSVSELKSANLLSVKQVSSRSNFAVVVATIHRENSLKVGVKTIGLEKIQGEWYVIPTDRIVQDAKYRLLAELLVGN